MGLLRRKATINLALQGGGAHGAFTWGVLDRLLENNDVSIGWISGASAGAINAVAVADGLAEGGNEAARAKLRAIWEGVYKAGVPDLMRVNPFFFGVAQAAALSHAAGLISPYDFNPLGFDPLRQLLTKTIDFERLRYRSPVELLISATDVATGQARLFRRKGLTVEAVLASACLPTLHHAVEIDGRGYWDGGFSANPDLVNLALESRVRDTLIVQLSPVNRNQLPTGAREIAGHVNWMTFNAPLLRDIEIITHMREGLAGVGAGRGGKLKILLKHRFHLIDGAQHTSKLSDESKLKSDKATLKPLFEKGRKEADLWLKAHRRPIGWRETVNLRAHFLDESIADQAKKA
ncbi:MAG: patatin-like phospholipase family protein [Alphaproteobacteria bacterium]|nr:patatin-like phospholipase family protein [Alphaproteobacteria bacterium]